MGWNSKGLQTEDAGSAFGSGLDVWGLGLSVPLWPFYRGLTKG